LETGESKVPQVIIHTVAQAGYLAAHVLDPPGGTVPQELRVVLEAHPEKLLPIMDKPGTRLCALWEDGYSEVIIYIIPGGADLKAELDPLRLPFPRRTDD
jgi:hypothetical protein